MQINRERRKEISMGRELTNVETETVRHRETKKKQLQSRDREREDDIQAIVLDFRSGFSMFFSIT